MESKGFDMGERLSSVFVVAAFIILLWLENYRPLRRSRDSKSRRDVRNLAFAALNFTAIYLTERPAALAFTGLVEARHWGALKVFQLPAVVELVLAIVLLDYTLFIWHVLTHKVPLLWRFHQTHHVDIDLDASTALRFHFGEMLLSVPWRSAQILVIGASPLALSLWQAITLLAILFHHSNVELPLAAERWLCRLIVTPRMHGIHHSAVHRETDSNWSTILAWPDYLHRTLRLNVPQQAITIGVPAYQDPADLGFGRVLAMPLTANRSSWQNETPRQETTLPPTELAR
jgi:sterol desaturase/sphingolipid hydroxylase (fatty acid hydroxylase superfamily)